MSFILDCPLLCGRTAKGKAGQKIRVCVPLPFILSLLLQTQSRRAAIGVPQAYERSRPPPQPVALFSRLKLIGTMKASAREKWRE